MNLGQAEITDSEFEQLRAIVLEWAGISLGDSKRQLVQSRLQKRLRNLKILTFGEYAKYLKAEGAGSEESIAFINCITTNKTDFFREPHHFEFVTKQIAPEIARAYHSGKSKELKVWHAGCSTGEEPYTMAMTLLEAFQTLPGLQIKMLATDIDTNVLAHAARGEYEADRVKMIPAPLLKKYFLRGSGSKSGIVKARPELTEMIRFKQLNLLSEPWPFRPDSQFDVIFCRNVVIYFDRPTQHHLFDRYAGMLRPGGYLFIGHSETVNGLSEKFGNLGGTIYRRLADRARAA